MRLNGWQRIGIVLSLLWTLCVSLWFLQHVSTVESPGIASVYLQRIAQPSAKLRGCRAKAEWFRDEARAEFRAGWPWFARGRVLIMWLLVYIVVWTLRWIRRGFKPVA
jgi:hypothetical protein